MSKDLGISTAYGYAVSRGYTGTEEEFAELMASYAHVAEDARASAETASNAKDDAVSAKNTAVTSAQTASNKASEAAQSAQNASTSANTASTKASEASASASNAQTSASTASTKASEAASSATAANSAKTDAVNAKNAAQTAQTASETARTAAEEAQASAEQAAQEAHDTLDKKAEIDGYYEEMTVGDAEQLVSSQYVSDSVPYLYRTTGGSADVGNREYMESIVGGTVAWNQLADNSHAPSSRNGLTITGGEDGFTVDGTATASTDATGWFKLTGGNNDYLAMNGHKVLVSFSIVSGTVTSSTSAQNPVYFGLGGSTGNVYNGTPKIVVPTVNSASNSAFHVNNGTIISNAKFRIQCFDLTKKFGPIIADYIYSLEQANAGAGVAWFKKLFHKDYYEYDAGALKHVEGLTSHDTVGFNQWDEEWELGTININTGINTNSSVNIRSKNYIHVLPNTSYYFNVSYTTGSGGVYYYDSNHNYIGYELLSIARAITTPSNAHYMRFVLASSYGTTYNNDICINLSWSGWRNGEYEPYQKHSYPLDSSLVLRGIPKLDAQNNLYYDGDVYNHDGTVERRYGIVDLGTMNWTRNTNESLAGGGNFQGNLSNRRLGQIYGYMMCSKYDITSIRGASNIPSTLDKVIFTNTNSASTQIYVIDSSYTDAASFKSAMSGVYLVYELATPTTEQAEPFQDVQICDYFGTEEFVTPSIVPVGHNTEYPANLRDKLQHLPNLADADGYYMIKQVDKQMSLEHFRIPKAPTEDGEYVLHATVSGGTPTYSWKTEEETA